MKTLHIFRDDFSAEQTWDLLDWCISHGARDFTAAPIGVGAGDSAILRQLEPFNRGEAKRRLFGGKAELVPIWELNAESITLLRSLLDEGLFTYGVGEDEWLEDPIFFRDQEFFLGIVTHENEGIVRVTPDEQVELEAKGIKHRPEGQWVGYDDCTTKPSTLSKIPRIFER
jgi:hypothetical protein